MPSNSFKLLIRSAHQVVQVVKNGERVVTGDAMNKIALLEANENHGISIVISRTGLIHDFGPDEEMQIKYKHASFDDEIEAHGKCVLPGFVDAHTHPVWAGDRVNEFSMKLAGASYMEVHEAGGGIYYTVDQTRKASEKHLLELLLARFSSMLRCGTTLVEAKSGYGLDTESEIKLLKVIEQGRFNSPIDVSVTYCGAHAVPKGKTAQEATDDIIQEQLPKIEQLRISQEVFIDSIDVFCEKGVYDTKQSKEILIAGQARNLRLNFHGDELNPMGAAEMGAELKADAISHLEKISSAGIKAISQSGTIAVILPTTAYMLKLTPPPVRDMIRANVPIALGSDYNPNAMCHSMPIVMNMACIVCHMTMAEALMAATLNAAAALGKAELYGSIEKGKMADFVIMNSPKWEHIIYQMGSNNLIQYVIKKGELVYRNMNSEILV